MFRIFALGLAGLAAGQDDSSTLVQVQHQVQQAQAPSPGQRMTLVVKAKASQRPGATVDCAGCFETAFDLTCMGRSLTFNILPNTRWARIDGKCADQNIGWRPAMDVEHTMNVTLRSTDIHTFCVTDGQDPQLSWCKDFHHTGYFPLTNTDRYRCRLKTAEMYYPLNRPVDRKKCYVSESEQHCLHAPTDFVVEDMPEPYVSEYIDHPRVPFSHCQGWGLSHIVRYPPLAGQKLNPQAPGTFILSSSDGGPEVPDLKLQVFKCPLTKSRPASMIVGAAIRIKRQVISMSGSVLKVNGVVQDRGLTILAQGVELDVSPRFVTIKGPTNFDTGKFAEVKIMIRKSRNSKTGYIYSVSSAMPAETTSDVKGLCNAPNLNVAARQFVPADSRFNLFDDDDIAALESTCCPDGVCTQPAVETEPTLEEVCGQCPTMSLQQAEAFCDEFSDRANQLLFYNCKFDICMSCDPLETLSETELEFSEEVDGEPVGLFGPLMPVGARADPHCSNVRGESFDIRTRGHMEMVELPGRGELRGKDLDVSALIQPIGSDPCSPTVITRLDVRGAWLPSHLALSLKPSPKGHLEMPQAWVDFMERPHAAKGNLTMENEAWEHGRKSVLVLKVNGLSIIMHQRKGTHTGTDYLDLEVKGLADFERAAGGLLGLDSHREVAKPVAGCSLDAAPVRLSEGTQEEPADGRLLSMATVS